ncbi:MAG: hypothetical protein AABY00_01990 [Nanoarchaeota archaeon]
MVFQEGYSRKDPAHILIFRYIVDKKEYLKNTQLHEERSQDGLDEALVHIGWAKRDRDGERCVVSGDVSLTYFNRSEGSYHVLEYRISKEDHLFLHPPDEKAKV